VCVLIENSTKLETLELRLLHANFLEGKSILFYFTWDNHKRETMSRKQSRKGSTKKWFQNEKYNER